MVKSQYKATCVFAQSSALRIRLMSFLGAQYFFSMLQVVSGGIEVKIPEVVNSSIGLRSADGSLE